MEIWSIGCFDRRLFTTIVKQKKKKKIQISIEWHFA